MIIETKKVVKSFIDENFKDHSIEFEVTIPEDISKGNLTCNAALILANRIKLQPHEVAEQLVKPLEKQDFINKVEVAGPGFINIFLTDDAFLNVVKEIREDITQLITQVEKPEKILIEFVSSNPTGPLHVGHGRGGVYGDTIARLLRLKGHKIHTEYYVNDAGRQMDILTASVWFRIAGIDDNEFPASGYKGTYIKNIATRWGDNNVDSSIIDEIQKLISFKDLPEDDEERIDFLIEQLKLITESSWGAVKNLALESMLDSIQDDLSSFGINFDLWFSESTLLEPSLTKKSKFQLMKDSLKEDDFEIDASGNVWFLSTNYGDDKDRVLIRDDGRPTYFGTDVAYHLDKLQRGFDTLINIWGSDHHGYIKRIAASIQSLGYDSSQFKVQLVQFANLIKDGSKIKMSTRSGNFYSLSKLIDEVGKDAARFFYLFKQADQHMDFDIDMAVSNSKENPFYYIQYGHARICSLQAKANLANTEVGSLNLEHLPNSCLSIVHELSKFPMIFDQACHKLTPHLLIFYLRDLTALFHRFYNEHNILDAPNEEKIAILQVLDAVKKTISFTFSTLGIKALESM